MSSDQKLKQIAEATLLAAGKPLSLDELLELFEEHERPERKALREALQELEADYAGRGIELREVASGFRIQVRAAYAPWVSRLWVERPARYSRALLETLALIAYRQPITRGEIEDIRGVSVSSNIIKTLMERDWVRVVGHRDVPGRPALYATTRQFLDYFSLKGLDELPTLAEIRDLDSINRELDLAEPGVEEVGKVDEAANDAELSVADVTQEQGSVEPAEAPELEQEPEQESDAIPVAVAVADEDDADAREEDPRQD